MAGPAQDSTSTTKPVASDAKDGDTKEAVQKPAAALEEDDEFEDFPVEGASCIPYTILPCAYGTFESS
jgi:26 proteasome complex subunit DSS1